MCEEYLLPGLLAQPGVPAAVVLSAGHSGSVAGRSDEAEWKKAWKSIAGRWYVHPFPRRPGWRNGRRARLRIWFRKECRFKSCSGYLHGCETTVPVHASRFADMQHARLRGGPRTPPCLSCHHAPLSASLIVRARLRHRHGRLRRRKAPLHGTCPAASGCRCRHLRSRCRAV